VALPQQEFYSYYDRSTAAVRRLRNVEGHHMGKAVEHLEAERWDLAMRECDFMLRYFPDHPRALYLLSTASIKAKTPERAEPYFQAAFDLFPESATSHSVHGIFLHKRGKLSAAIKAYRDSLALDPGSAETHYNLGLSYMERGEYELANRHAQAAYSLGYPLPGLRDKLRSAGKWSSLPDTVLTRLTTRGKADASQ
jgi:tetratricopeptide (TPR) repeat protein